MVRSSWLELSETDKFITMKTDVNIPFNKPYMTGKELWYISQAHANGHLAGDGEFTKLCSQWLEKKIGCGKSLLTHSCTAALEMTAILANIQPGDEIIMPSYTFVSTANAFVLRGGVPVFVDVRSDTLNIDEQKIEAAISNKTKAIVVVHYAGVACDMDPIMNIAQSHGLYVIEDAAQGLMSSYKGRPLGSIGHMATLSFHETKNIISGEGGALLINDESLVDRAEVVREKGTNRSQFFRGAVDKYTWVDIGSSFLPGEVVAAFLWAQLEEAESITEKRKAIWQAYDQWFRSMTDAHGIQLPHIPDNTDHNAHMYYLIVNNVQERNTLIGQLKKKNIHSVFHYVPLHSAPTGLNKGRVSGEMPNTDSLSSRLVRLPFWIGIEQHQARVIREVVDHIQS